MKIWKYNNFDLDSKSFINGEPKTPIILAETQPDSEYSEVSDIVNIDKIDIDNDYLYKRNLIKINSPVWTEATEIEKEVLLKYYAFENNSDAIGFLMGKGLTQSEAIDTLYDIYSTHVVKDAEACEKRISSKEITKVVLTYLNPQEATDFLKVTENLELLYRLRGIKGLNDGSSREGLFDFLESTNSYTGEGLEEQGYTLKVGTYAGFINDLMNILREGNYGS